MRIDAAERIWIMEIKLNIQSKKEEKYLERFFLFPVVEIVRCFGGGENRPAWEANRPDEDLGDEELSGRPNKHE